MPAVATYQVGSRINQRRSGSWPDLAIVLADHLLDYRERRPDEFRYLGSDEEVAVTGFADYLRNLGQSAVPQGSMTKIRTKGDQVLDPWGKPIRYGLDRDHDGYIDMQGQRALTSAVHPPNLEYYVAVAVSLNHKDNEEFRPHVRRR